MADLITVDLHLVQVHQRLRSLKDHRVQVLAQDIDFQGLLQPILVQVVADGYRLVDGAHRLAAAQRLGWHQIAAQVLPAETSAPALAYAEIMANLDREDLTKLERAEHLAALKSAWAALNPAARHGGDRRSAAVRAVKEAQAEADDQSPILGLWSELAEKVGLGRAAFFAAIQIATNLTDASKARIRDTWIEDHQATLMALAREDAATQAGVLDLLLADPAKANTVTEALLVLQGRALPTTPDKLYATAVSTWSRLPKSYRDAFLEAHKREVMDLVKRKGWL